MAGSCGNCQWFGNWKLIRGVKVGVCRGSQTLQKVLITTENKWCPKWTPPIRKKEAKMGSKTDRGPGG